MSNSSYTILIDQLAETPRFFRKTLFGLPLDLMRRKAEGDNLHLQGHLWHVLDCDTDLYGLRIRRILSEHQPQLVPVDVGAWPAARGYDDRNGDDAITAFETERAQLIASLQSLSTEQIQRVGVRADQSEISVLGVVQQLLEHDQEHQRRIAAILAGFARVV